MRRYLFLYLRRCCGFVCLIVASLLFVNGYADADDGWLDTSYAYRLRSSHPRVVMSTNEFETVVQRMYGASASEPYAAWFNRIKAREDEAQVNPAMTPHTMSLALIYKATGDVAYRDMYRAQLNAYLDARTPGDGSGPSTECLYSMDIMWDEIGDDEKLKVYELSSPQHAFYYQSGANFEEQDFYYHGAYRRDQALAFALNFACDPILEHPDVVADQETYSFDPELYIATIMEELSPSGTFWRAENRIAGDPTHNDALPGDFGGMYDNMGYDASEEACSIFLIAPFTAATGQDKLTGFLHDQYRGRFYQNFETPHRIANYGSGENAYESHEFARIWNTQTVWFRSPNKGTVALVADRFADPHMQYYADRWRKELNVYNYDYFITRIWQMLLYYDHTLDVKPPESNPCARYFSGPGLVTMRSDWSKDAAFAVFAAGEGISRRYEDANSFIIHRKTDLMPIAGARIRNNPDNDKHHWYHIRSVSKNTLKIFDPDEAFDIDANGKRAALHTGVPLVPSDNLGGQLYETARSLNDEDYGGGPSRPHDTDAIPSGEFWETANIVKYEHVPGRYTYSVGDGTSAYTRKIDYFLREFLFVRPDCFVIFDKVKSVNPDFKKVWVVHTVDEPVVQDALEEQNHGMKAYTDSGLAVISHGLNTAYVSMVFPEENRVVARGGDTLLTSGHALNASTPIAAGDVLESDIPRWLELFAIGADVEGVVTIMGNAVEGDGVSEDIIFDGNTQTYVSAAPTLLTTNSLEDVTQHWKDNEWSGYMLALSGGSADRVLIAGNNETTLSLAESCNPAGVWRYTIYRPMANSTLHWQTITNITTADMDVDNFLVSIPHYFDAENADGKLYSFSPHTDGKDDGYRKRKDFGQWTLNIEARVPRMHDNFLNVIFLTDPGGPNIAMARVTATNSSGVLLKSSFLALFANGTGTMDHVEYSLGSSGSITNFIAGVTPSVWFRVCDDGSEVCRLISSPQGTLYFDVDVTAGQTIGVLSEAAPSDSDGDGMPNDWETANALDPLNAWDASLDPDKDEMTNLGEYIAGTDPRDNGSSLMVDELMVETDRIRLLFDSVTGRVYEVWRCDSMTVTNWMELTNGVPGTGGEVLVDDPADVARRFYRLKARLE